MTPRLEQLREQVGRMAGLGSLTSERLFGGTVAELARSAVELATLYGGPEYGQQVQERLQDAIASWAHSESNGGSTVATETARDLRRRVARDSGLPLAVADEWVGEVEDVVVEEALAHALRTRGAAGQREVVRRLTEIGSRERPEEIRARVGRALDLPFELREKLSNRTETAEEVANDALRLLRESGDEAAFEKASAKADSLAMSGYMRSQVRGGDTRVVEGDDMNALLRAAAGRDPNAA